MVYKNNSKRGQAAIEFLMTYGWMLLVVLIVGALIFSFVDFGSLLPNKLDLSNNLRGDATASVAYSDGYGTANEQNEVRVVFVYNGAKQSQIAYDGGVIENSLGNKCLSYNVTNLDTGADAGCAPGDAGDCTIAVAADQLVPFLNGQTGIMNFICSDSDQPTSVGGVGNAPTAGDLLINDVLEGQITIKVKNAKTGLDVPSAGPIRLTIGQ